MRPTSNYVCLSSFEEQKLKPSAPQRFYISVSLYLGTCARSGQATPLQEVSESYVHHRPNSRPRTVMHSLRSFKSSLGLE